MIRDILSNAGLIPIYCENPIFGFQIFNVVSNFAYFVVAFLLWFSNRKINKNRSFYTFLILILSIGLGSFWWHATDSVIGLIFDTLPIYILIFYFIFSYIKKSGKSTKAFVYYIVTLITLLILGSITLIGFGSIRYIIFLLVGVYLYFDTRHSLFVFPKYYISGLIVFLIAITIRALDELVCDVIPLGTHFLWHITSSIAIYLIVSSLRLNYENPRHHSKNKRL